jgi:hypothetical protein
LKCREGLNNTVAFNHLGGCIPDDPRAEVALDMVGVVSACSLDGKNGTDELATADIVAELIAVVG